MKAVTCVKKAVRLDCGIPDNDGSVFCKSTDCRRSGDQPCLFDQQASRLLKADCPQVQKKVSPKKPKRIGDGRRNSALNDILSISDNFGVIGARACQVRRGTKADLKKSFPVPMDRNEAIERTRRMLNDAKNAITGVIVFTSGSWNYPLRKPAERMKRPHQ